MTGEYTGGTYSDHLGNDRNYTFIDHSKKSKLSGFVPDGFATEQHRKDRENLISKIKDISPSLCPLEFDDFKVRSENQETIDWNYTMLSDEGLPFDRLLSLYTIIKNRFNQINTAH